MWICCCREDWRECECWSVACKICVAFRPFSFCAMNAHFPRILCYIIAYTSIVCNLSCNQAYIFAAHTLERFVCPFQRYNELLLSTEVVHKIFFKNWTDFLVCAFALTAAVAGVRTITKYFFLRVLCAFAFDFFLFQEIGSCSDFEFDRIINGSALCMCMFSVKKRHL